jgi:hypothetical protein
MAMNPVRINRCHIEKLLSPEQIQPGNKVRMLGKIWIIAHVDDQDVILDETEQCYGT